MTADVELLPLPEDVRTWLSSLRKVNNNGSAEHIEAWFQRYARANVEHHTEALRAEVEKAKRSVEHTHQWYAVRLEKIKEVAKRVGLWSEVAAIIANGSSSIYDPPTYSQQLNIAKHETKAAEARAERLAEALDIIARVGKASRNQTTRTRWIVARAVSALNNDDDWRALPKPKGFHDALLHPTAAQENDDA